MKIVSYEYFVDWATNPQFLYVDVDCDKNTLPPRAKQIIETSEVKNVVEAKVVQQFGEKVWKQFMQFHFFTLAFTINEQEKGK